MEISRCKNIKITDIDGDIFIGNIIEITDAEERSDIEEQEDGVTINIKGHHIEFMVSEIKNIEIIT